MSVDLKKLHHLLFYAIDKASPKNLALSATQNTLGKIALTQLTDLLITPSGKADMWQIIDTSVEGYAGGEVLAPAVQTTCKTPGQMWEAQCKASNIIPAPAPDSVL